MIRWSGCIIFYRSVISQSMIHTDIVVSQNNTCYWSWGPFCRLRKNGVSSSVRMFQNILGSSIAIIHVSKAFPSNCTFHYPYQYSIIHYTIIFLQKELLLAISNFDNQQQQSFESPQVSLPMFLGWFTRSFIATWLGWQLRVEALHQVSARQLWATPIFHVWVQKSIVEYIHIYITLYALHYDILWI